MHILDRPLEIKQGDTLLLDIEWRDSAGTALIFEEADNKIDRIRMHFRETPNSELLLGISTESGEIVLSDRTVNIRVESEVMQEFTAQRGVFDLEVTYEDGTVKTELTGRFRLIEDIAYNE